METADEPIPGMGKAFEIELDIEADIDEGRIGRWVSTYDVERWQRQMGLVDAA